MNNQSNKVISIDQNSTAGKVYSNEITNHGTPSEKAISNNSSEFQASARVYRPKTFAELIGQDVLVKTLSNAIETGRVPHAMIFTGTRGVGKTTTARIIARSLNCVGPDGNGKETTTPCGECEHCKAILNDSHMDVIEMDAASRTSIDDIREIIEAAKYKAISARYKIYIIDEVHMLSKSAFNGLLKTLEEPPAHVKFIFATTEIDKVPNTILSRCMRFDLQRVEIPELIKHFSSIAAKQNINIDEKSLALIAKAADGSVRDGMSILDQAIVISNGNVSYDKVAKMLGIADKKQIIELFSNIVSGNTIESLRKVDLFYSTGTSDNSIISEIADLVHKVTSIKIDHSLLDDPMYNNEERKTLQHLADNLTIPELSRYWQMLIKGYEDIKASLNQHHSLRMLVIRMCYVADVPTPDKLLEKMEQQQHNNSNSNSNSNNNHKVPAMELKKKITSYNDILSIIDLYRNDDEYFTSLFDSMVHFVSIDTDNKTLSIRIENAINKNEFLPKINQKINLFSKDVWKVINVDKPGQPSILEQKRTEMKNKFDRIKTDPLVVAILESFPGAKIENIENIESI